MQSQLEIINRSHAQVVSARSRVSKQVSNDFYRKWINRFHEPKPSNMLNRSEMKMHEFLCQKYTMLCPKIVPYRLD